MAQPTTIQGNVVVTGTLSPGALNAPAASIGTAALKTGNSNIATVLQYQHALRHVITAADLTTEIAASVAKVILPVAQFAGEILGVRFAAITAPTGGDKACTVDVLKNGSTSVLSSAIGYSSSQSNGDAVAGTLKTDGTEDFAIDDYYTFTVTIGGSTGTNLKGWMIEVYFRQYPAAA